MNKNKVISGFAALGLAWGFPLGAQAGQTQPPAPEKESNTSPFVEWWNGKYATGNWFGVRDTLEDHGLNFRIEWKANLLWNVDGGLQQRFGYDDEWKFTGNLDFAKLTGWDAVKGLSLYSSVRYRGGAGVNKWVGASSNFSPSTFQGGRLWRFQTVYLTYVTPELFGIKEFLTLSGGWQNPADHFITQPENKFFINNTFNSGRGLSANGFQWGGSYSAWGGYTKVKPVDWYYAQGGLYVAIPQGNVPANHGLDFAGYRRDPDLNGVYFLAETGVTPKIGPSKLPGRYAAGAIYFGVENSSFNGSTNDGRWAFYWQADQMLYRAPSPEEPGPLAKGPSDGKSVSDGKEPPVVKSKPKLTDKGLYFFSLFEYAPEFNNVLPFYFHAGLIYKGLIPTRDKDQLGFAIAYGNYSFDKIEAQNAAGRGLEQTYEGVLEWDYRIQVNNWSYIQPVVQYIFRPNGAGVVSNATVIGMQIGVLF
jgi:porin